jgi:hypothetical protein
VCNAAVFSDAVNLENSLKNISRTIKPRLNQSDQVNVTIFMALNSIQDYDEQWSTDISLHSKLMIDQHESY